MTNEELERAVERLKKYLAERKKSRVHDPIDIHALHIGDEPTLYRAGKKAAGRLLDGVLHDGFPEVRA